MRRFLSYLLMLALMGPTLAQAEKITIAAAADLKFAMDEVIATFSKTHPGNEVSAVYGSSGNFQTQIRNGAPYDLYFSADINYPRALVSDGLAASAVKPYAVGRIVIWSASQDARQMTLGDLAAPSITRIAIANPQHAPYGKRAEEALKASGLWDKIQSKLVFGENVGQAAQYVSTGNAQVGIIALSLAMSPALSSKGGYALVPDTLHGPLEQGYIITKRAASNPLAKQFADYLGSPAARSVMVRYGFVLPGDAIAR